jgi:glycosyltransferase involved in cell wall biosynthesis
MKILQVCPVFPEDPMKSGNGVTSVVYQISKELAKLGHEVTLFTSMCPSLNKKLDITVVPIYIDNIKIYRFPYIACYYNFYITLNLFIEAQKNLQNFDIIHFHDMRCFQSLVCYYIANKKGIPYVLQTHGSLPGMAGERRLKKLLDNLFGYKIILNAKKIIALNRREAELIMENGIDKSNVEILPNGVDASYYQKKSLKGRFRERYSIDTNTKIILYLGRIHKIKGIDLLVEAFSDVKKQFKDVILVIVGQDSGFLKIIELLIKFYNLEDSVILTGALFEEDKLEALQDANIFVLPSVYETFPITVLEACACGLPIIVTDRCGIADVIDNRVGLVVPYDKDYLRDAILHMLSEDKLRQDFSKNGKLLVRDRFNWEKIAEQVERIYLNSTSPRD